MQMEGRPSVGVHDDLEITPADRARELRACQRLEAGLLRREPRCVTPRRLRTPPGVIDLAEGEQPLQGALSLGFQKTLDAVDVDEVQSDSDHGHGREM